MKIAVLSRNPRLYSTRRLVEAGQQRGHEMVVIDTLRAYMNIASHKPQIHYRGQAMDGFDAVMLSGETAVGHDPVGTVEAMSRIVQEAETHVSMPNLFADANPETAAVTAAAAALAKRIGAEWIVSLTYTGYSARLLSACRPSCPIISITPSPDVARQLRIVKGVMPLVKEREPDVDKAISEALREARLQGLTSPGDRIVVCASRTNPRSDADTLWLHQES